MKNFKWGRVEGVGVGGGLQERKGQTKLARILKTYGKFLHLSSNVKVFSK